MALCPEGHESETEDFCDDCGLPIVAAPAAAPDERCPWCGTPRAGRFCDEDGYDFVAPPAGSAPGPTPAWVVTIEADRRYFDLVGEREGPDFGSVSFPTAYPVREVVLGSAEVRVGRAPAPVALHIDLSGPPTDPGVSRLHAVLLERPDGGWAVLDPGSTNGTTINYDDEPITTDRPVPIGDGDRVHLGAYTTLVLAERVPSG